MPGAIRTAGLKQINRQLLLDAFCVSGDATKTALSERTQLSVTTCAEILEELLSEGRIIELSPARSGGGRPARRFSLNADFEHALCLFATNWDMDGERVVWRVYDMRGIARESGVLELERVALDSILALVRDISRKDPLLRVVGVGVPGVISEGAVDRCDLKWLSYVDIAGAVRALGLRCVMLNDLNGIAQGLSHSLGENRDVAVIAWPGNSLPGAGFVIDGKTRRGLNNFAGEVACINYRITDERQLELLSSRDTFMEAALPVLCSVITVLAPDEVAVTGKAALMHSAEEYREACASAIRPSYLPRFTLLEKYDDEYLLGLFHECQESSKYPVRLVDR